MRVRITAPFSVGDVVASIHRDGADPVVVVLRDGEFSGEVTAARRIQLTIDPAPPGEAPLRVPGAETPAAPEGPVVDVETLFDEGYAIPENGRLTCQLLWGSHCHNERVSESTRERRFGSWEHMMCAEYVGMARVGEPRSPLVVNGIRASFSSETLLPVGDKRLAFGEIVALGGDFYAHLDDAAARAFEWAWPSLEGFRGWLANTSGDYRRPTLAVDSVDEARYLLGIIVQDKDTSRGTAGEFAVLAFDTVLSNFPARRYLALASQNFCHFAAVPAPGGANDVDALRLYRAYHMRALQEAAAAGETSDQAAALKRALVTDAFGCHFLTDLFASGHMRVPRRQLAERYGILRGSLKMSMAMHGEDNVRGLWCSTRGATAGGPRVVWRAYGDGSLRKEEARVHLRQVQEAVRRSAAEVFAAYVAGVPAAVTPAPVQDILPALLGPGESPGLRDTLPDGSPLPDRDPNHWPLYLLTATGDLVRRSGTTDSPLYP